MNFDGLPGNNLERVYPDLGLPPGLSPINGQPDRYRVKAPAHKPGLVDVEVEWQMVDHTGKSLSQRTMYPGGFFYELDPAVRETARGRIDRAAQEAKTEVDDLAALSQSEKDDAKRNIDSVTERAKTEIDAAETQETVEQARDTGAAQIDRILKAAKLTHAKSVAKQELEERA